MEVRFLLKINQFAPTISFGDAISNQIILIQNILDKNGYASSIYVRNSATGFSKYLQSYKKFNNQDDSILIHHFSIGDPLNDFVNALPNKKILIHHNITPSYYFNGFNDELASACQLGRFQLKQFNRNVQIALADSEYNRLELDGLGFKNTDVLPLCIDFNNINYNIINETLYEKYDGDYVNILFVGRIAPNKKQENIIKTFYYYNKYINGKSRLFLVGSFFGLEKYYYMLKTLVDNLNLENNVIFTGKVNNEDLATYYKLADIFFCLSEHEGFCVPLLEAMHFKIPILALKSSAIPHTLENSGILIKRIDYKEISELINFVVCNESLRNIIIKNQLIRLEHFTPDNFEKKLLKSLNNVGV